MRPLWKLLRFMTCISVYVKIYRASWITASDPLPRSDDEYAIGEYNGKITLIGGFNDRGAAVEITIDTYQVEDLGRQFLPSDTVGGKGQYWTQQAHIVYLVHPDGFDTFNLATKEFTTNWKSIQLNTYVDQSCVASSESFLYVVGGENDPDNPFNTVQMLSLISYSWMSDPPSMKTERCALACIVYNEYLWAFAGQGMNNDEVASNERIQTTNIAQNTWQFIEPLTIAVKYIRAVSSRDTIFIVGGHDAADKEYDLVHLVDANTGAVTVSQDKLPWECDYSAPIIVDRIFCVFGCNYNNDEWAYYILPSSNPTSSPTENPSNKPTSSPTHVTVPPWWSNWSSIVIDDNANNIRYPILNHSFGTMNILDNVHVEFDFKVLSSPTQPETNILHIGSDLEPHLPSIRIEGSGFMRKVSVWFSLLGNPSAHIDAGPIVSNWHHLSFDLTQSTADVWVDNMLIATRQNQGSHAILRNQDIYILSHPFYPSLDGLIRDLKITTDNAYTNYLCDYANRFTTYDGTWVIDIDTSISKCWLRQTTFDGGTLAWLGDKDQTSIQWTDYTIEIEVRLIAEDGNSAHAGVLFRALSVNSNLNGGQQYLVDLKPASNAIRLSTINAGSIQTERSVTPGNIEFGQDYTLRVEVVGKSISVYLDDQHQFDHNLTAYTHGSIGLRTHICDARFKNLRILFPNTNTRITLDPTASPTRYPTNIPTHPPTANPTDVPTANPSTMSPTHNPTDVPTAGPTLYPTDYPTLFPTLNPTLYPTLSPTNHPTRGPTLDPTLHPTLEPTNAPTHPTFGPTHDPTTTANPSVQPTPSPTLVVTIPNPTQRPTWESTVSLKDTMISTPSTDGDEIRGNNAGNSELPLWISLAIVCICVVVGIIVCVKRRAKDRKDHAVYNIGTVNSNNSDMVEMIGEPKPVHVLTEDVMHLEVQPKHAANVNKQQSEEHDQDITELIEWLTSTVRLPQYVSNFADNGYETMAFVRDISTVEELQDIGITLKGHQNRILARVDKLNAEPKEKKLMVVEKEQKRQGHKPQRSVLDELEGGNEPVAPLTLEGSPPELNLFDHDVIDIQGGVTLGSLPQDHQMDSQTVSPKMKYVFDNEDDQEVL